MKSIDIIDTLRKEACLKFLSNTGIELVYSLLKKGKIETVTIINGNWIGNTKEGKSILCGQFHTAYLLEFFKGMNTVDQDSIIMMLSVVLNHMPTEQRSPFRNLIIELIG